MIHVDETKIELYILNAPEVEQERATIEAHLKECAGCKEMHDEIAAFYADVKSDLEKPAETALAHSHAHLARPKRPLQRKFRDRSPLREVDVALPVRVARWVVRHPVASTASSFGIVTLIAALLVQSPRTIEKKIVDLNPVVSKFAGEMFFIQNKRGETIDEVNVGDATVAMAIIYQQADFCDVDRDGINEVIWAEMPPQNSRDGGKIHCRSLTQKKDLWTKSLTKAYQFLNQPGQIDSNYRCRILQTKDLDSDGKAELYIVTFHDQFPSYLLVLDPETGAERSTYLHIGHLLGMTFADIDHDGITDILLCGINNSFHQACLIVLDPRYINGMSPHNPLYDVEGAYATFEKAYVRFPKTIVGETFNSTSDYNSAFFIELLNSDQKFKITFHDQNENSNSTATLYGYFGFDLRPLDFNTATDYDMLANKLIAEGAVNRRPDKIYFEEYRKRILYWDGEKWQHHSVIRRLKQPS